MVAASHTDSTISLWTGDTHQPAQPIVETDFDAALKLALSPDEQVLASGGSNGVVKLWSLPDGELLAQWPAAEAGFGFPVSSLSFSPDGQTLVSGNALGELTFLDPASAQPLADPLPAHSEAVTALIFSADGSHLASGSPDGTVMPWDATTRQPLLNRPYRQRRGVNALAFSPAGQTLYVAGLDGQITLWDVGHQEQVGPPFNAHQAPILALSLSQDGRTLASTDLEGRVILWPVDVASWRALACRRANRNLAPRDWERMVGDGLPYQAPCPDLPVPEEDSP
jgi:WD40 repeat protein